MAWEKSIFMADSHGDLVCRKTLKKFYEFMDDWKPKHRVHLGDCFDFRSLRLGASNEDRADSIKYDYQCGIDLLTEYKPTMLTLGNHDDRLWRIAAEHSNRMLADLAEEKANETEDFFRKMKIQWTPYDARKRLKIGNLSIFHGFMTGENVAKKHFSKYLSCIFGHVHTSSSWTADFIDGGGAHSVATMADIDRMNYAKSKPGILGHRKGWAWGLHNTKTGAHRIYHATVEDGVIVSPQGIL
jgi:predicted phosphodiesterase